MFLNRTHELAQLQRWWDGNQPELITLYGRRQVGKTELLVHFIAGKPALYFYADRQLNDLSDDLAVKISILSDVDVRAALIPARGE